MNENGSKQSSLTPVRLNKLPHPHMKHLSAATRILLAFVIVKILLHFFTANTLGFHRDEFLYLALGRHLDWGFWSNPPFIGLVGWCTQHLLGDSLLATRVPSAFAGGALLLLTGLMVRDLGGGRFAQVVCGTAMLFSLAWLRTSSMLQPVPFDILCWTFLSFSVVKWLKTGDTRWWWAIGAGVGVGFLIKYSLVFWITAFVPALLLTPRRTVLLTRAPWLSVMLAFVIILPNLLWQWHYHFPVVHHMEELARNQLDHVQPINFLVDQLLMQGPGGALIWLTGLVFLLRSDVMRPYRLVAWFYIFIILVFLALNGKSYYTLGAYPVLTAAGSVFWERFLQKTWSRTILVAAVALPGLLLFPTGIPLWPAPQLQAYFQRLTDAGIVTTRWEDGDLHPLPQDYADMLGWTELAAVTDSAIAMANTDHYIVYGENYGQAGAVSILCRTDIKNHTYSFSDSYRLWAPLNLPQGTQTLIYINDELGDDIQNLFADIRLVGGITHPLARERGTTVWLCQQPRRDLAIFWSEVVQEVRSRSGLSPE